MNPCIIFFSRTGNTKKLAQAIADATKAPIYDLASTQPSAIENCGVLILGTPVEGANPAKETVAFIDNMPQTQGKKVILFCTYRAFGNERTMKNMEKRLAGKGYQTIAKVSKKGMKPEKEADFSDILSEIKSILEKQ
ncbi:MAG TPA: flavodoxin family protein [Candidatus Acidoferrum sp.]|nr:flavodoxin family protein [Candidatus Acidoferrum sp.]